MTELRQYHLNLRVFRIKQTQNGWTFIGDTGGALPYADLYGTCCFPERGMKIDQKFRNGLLLFVQEQKAIIFKNNRLLFSLLFYNLKIPKRYQNANFFPKRAVEILKKWALPRQVTFKCLPPGGDTPKDFAILQSEQT